MFGSCSLPAFRDHKKSATDQKNCRNRTFANRNTTGTFSQSLEPLEALHLFATQGSSNYFSWVALPGNISIFHFQVKTLLAPQTYVNAEGHLTVMLVLWIKHSEQSPTAAEAVPSRTRTLKVWEHFTLDAAKKQTTCNICKVDLVKLRRTCIMNEQLKWRPVGLLNVNNADLDLHRQHS